MRKPIVFISILLTLVFCARPCYAQTALEQLANSMQPGTWAELDTTGLTQDFIETTPLDGLESQQGLFYEN